MMKIMSNTPLLGRYGVQTISDGLWVTLGEQFKEFNFPAHCATSMRKSYTIHCYTVAVLRHLRVWHISIDFYSILVRDRGMPNVARLNPISLKHHDAFKSDIEDVLWSPRLPTTPSSTGIIAQVNQLVLTLSH